MVILIGNQKGGAGKSTLTLLLANYLASVRSRKVTVLDMDYQQSLAAKYEKAGIVDSTPLYEIIPSDLKHYPVLVNVLGQNKEELILVDLPGRMDDDRLIPVIESGELVLCPTNYDEFSVDSTLLFAMVTRRINEKVPIVFVPNRIKANVKYETRTEVDKVLTRFGVIGPAVAERVDFQRLSIFHIPALILPVVLPALDMIYESYITREGAS